MAQKSITITNPGFEDPVLGNGAVQVGAPPGWSVFNGAQVGVLNPFDTDLTNEAPEGENVGYVEASANEDGLSQVLTRAFQADANYTLSVFVGNTLFSTDFPGYRVQLLAGGTLLAEVDDTQTVPLGGVATSTVTYSYDEAQAGLVGEPLEIRLLSKGEAPGAEVAFDGVQLTIALANPAANAGGPYSVIFGGSLTLDGSASLPSGGETITAWEWDLDNDGNFDEGITGATPATIDNATLTAAPPAGFGMVEGPNTIRLRVTDSAAKTSTVETTVTLLPFIEPSLEVDFQATIASEQHPSYTGEARFFHVSVNPNNPGTGSYAATIVGTNDPAPPFVRNFDGPVLAYKFAGGTNNDITAVAQQGGSLGGDIITFTTTDTSFDGFGQQQAKLWTTSDPGPDLGVSGPNPFNVTANTNATGGWRSLSDATGVIDISSIPAGSLHIYYGAFNATPSVSVVMRDTNTGQPDIVIPNAHLNNDFADRTEYYLAEIDFVSGGIYDEIEFVWNAGSANGRGIAVVVTGAAPEDLVAPTLDPEDITNNSGGEPILSGTPLIYTLAFSELMDPATISADDFELVGSASATITNVVHFGSVTTVNVLTTTGTSGTLQLQVKAGAVLTDLAGNPLDTTVAVTDDTTITVIPDPPPTVVSIVDNQGGGPVLEAQSLAYTVTFDQAIDPVSVDVTDFENADSPAISVNAVARTSDPGVFVVHVTPGGPGTITLQIAEGAVITNLNGTPVDTAAAIADDTTITVNPGAGPDRGVITVDGFVSWSANALTLTGTLNASGSDKLVVIVTGEHGNPGDHTGNSSNVTYDGVQLTKIVDRDPIPGTPQDQTFNDIWYLDNPGAVHVAGAISASVSTRGSVTAFALSGTAPGAGQTAISPQASKSVILSTTFANSLVIASHGMGGDGNTANVTAVSVVAPLEGRTATAQASGSPAPWDGHVCAYAFVPTPGTATYAFSGGNLIGSHTIAAEFFAAEAGTPPVDGPFATWSGGLPAEGDANGDGIANALAWVLGAADPNANALGLLPTLDNASDAEYVVFAFNRLVEANNDPDTTIAVEYSTDLVGWTTAVHDGDDVIIDVTADTPSDAVEVKLKRSSLAHGGKLFVRLNVEVEE